MQIVITQIGSKNNDYKNLEEFYQQEWPADKSEVEKNWILNILETSVSQLWSLYTAMVHRPQVSR